MMTMSKAVTLTGNSTVEDAVVATMYANLENGSVNVQIMDKDLYAKNKTQVQQDIADFNKAVYAELDQEA